MMDLETICNALKQVGVQEIILEINGDGDPIIEFNGFDGKYFKIMATNTDFSNEEL